MTGMQVSKLRIYVNIIPNAEKLFLLGHAISSSRILNLYDYQQCVLL